MFKGLFVRVVVQYTNHTLINREGKLYTFLRVNCTLFILFTIIYIIKTIYNILQSIAF